MIHIENVSKRFGAHWAVRDLSLLVEPGRVTCLLGPNGAGKTTTLKMVLGLHEPTTGTVRVDGVDVSKEPLRARRALAYIPERVALHDDFTGFENLAYFASLAGAEQRDRDALEACLDTAGLQSSAWDERLAGYSKGMRQKVAVAIALAKRARALVLDEPTSGLDPSAAHDFSELVLRTSAAGAAILVATHDLFRARDIGTELIIMRAGRAVARLDPASASYEDVDAAYLGTVRGHA